MQLCTWSAGCVLPPRSFFCSGLPLSVVRQPIAAYWIGRSRGPQAVGFLACCCGGPYARLRGGVCCWADCSSLCTWSQASCCVHRCVHSAAVVSGCDHSCLEECNFVRVLVRTWRARLVRLPRPFCAGALGCLAVRCRWVRKSCLSANAAYSGVWLSCALAMAVPVWLVLLFRW